jgi:diadenosine tetraphosphatase ApaH/serine/threonine PP2A family protein phosphatase
LVSENNSNKMIVKKELLLLLPIIDSIFESESAVLRTNSEPIMIVGDIHGDLQALNFILGTREEVNCKNILFLGDYVDRGLQSTEVLLKLFKLKIEDPEHIFLLRGNHEDAEMNLYDGFYEEIGYDNEFLIRINHTYNKMPIAAVFSEYTFCVHGGIGGTGSIDTINKEEWLQYLWNDPSESPGFTPSNRGPGIKEYGPDILESFLATNNLKRIVRGHQYYKEGYKWWFDGKLLSLFSCPDYVGQKNNGAFAIYEKGELKLFDFGNQQE